MKALTRRNTRAYGSRSLLDFVQNPGASAMEETMRMLMKVSFPVEAGNRAIVDGSLPKTIQAILEEQKPEAVYFVAEGGKRTGYLFLDLKSTADIPGIAEPWFLAFNA